MMENAIQQEMFKRIVCWQQSNLKQKAWCEQNNLPYATFHYWYKRYRQQFHVDGPKTNSDFIKVALAGPVAGGWCELSFANGKKLTLQQPVTAEFLRLLID